MAETDPAELVARLVDHGELTGATLSRPRRVDPTGTSRIVIEPVDVRAGRRYRWRHHLAQQTRDEIVTVAETGRRLAALLAESVFRQALLRSSEADFQVLGGGGGGAKPKIIRRPPSRPAPALTHDRQKRRLLPEGTPVPFLVELGVMTAEGAVRAKRYDKYRQVSRFVELVDDIVPALPPGPLRVVDFGSGRAYLTFALHHLLTEVHGREVELHGLDVKADVVRSCQDLAARLGCEGLTFSVGEIGAAPLEHADLVVALHACDTATDDALARAVGLGAAVILAVPCCHRELRAQLTDDALTPLLRHGVLRERFAADATDAARARLLQLVGYDVQVVEFVDLEHTPKNLLLRATRVTRPARDTARLAREYRTFADELSIRPTLERLLELDSRA